VQSFVLEVHHTGQTAPESAMTSIATGLILLILAVVASIGLLAMMILP